MTDVSSAGPSLEDTITRTRDIANQVQAAARQQQDHDVKLRSELKGHAATKDKIKDVEVEHKRITGILGQETREHNTTKLALGDKERYNLKAQEALKSLADDLVSVRLHNEALRAEMEKQRKEFVVSVNWAARHAELKAKVEEIQIEHEKLLVTQADMKVLLDSAVRTHEEYMSEHRGSVEELEAMRKQLAEQTEQHGLTASMGEDVAEQLAELQILKRQIEMDKERSAGNKEKAKKQLEKSFLQGDSSLLRTAVGAWVQIAKTEKQQKAKKEQSRAVAMRGIANSGLAMQDFCLTAWHKLLEEKKKEEMEAARRALEEKGVGGEGAKRARQKALAQMEKQFLSQDNGLVREVLISWQGVKVERLRKDKAKAMAYRTVAGGTQALLQQVHQAWAGVMEEHKLTRVRKAAGNAKGLRMIANGNNAMMDFCLTAWAKLSQQAAATKKAKDCGNTKALKMMANSGMVMVGLCFTNWATYIKNSKAKSKKMRAVERNLVQGGAAMVQMVFSQWKAWQEGEHKKKKSKMSRMHVAEKAIQGNSAALMSQVFHAWDRIHDQAIEDRKKEALKSVKGTVDQAALDRSREALDELRKEMEEMKAATKSMTKRMEEAESELKKKNEAHQLREMDLGKIRKELDDSKRKAKDINEELAKVGQFLAATPPRRAKSPSRDKRGSNDTNQLPRIDGAPSSRPRSGTRKGDATKGVPAPAGDTKTAWDA